MVKSRLAGVILSCMLLTPGWAATPSPSLIATPPQPKWSELTVQQKIVLAPLSDDWDSFEYYRQKQWLGITARFPTMTSEEQRRIQKQMQEWGKLTPEQRQKARENFLTATQLPTEKKQELKQKWEEYSNLPAEEKEKFKQQARTKTTPNAISNTVPKAAIPAAETPSFASPAVLQEPSSPPSTVSAPAVEAATVAAPISTDTTSKP